jgi:hypothetical protein
VARAEATFDAWLNYTSVARFPQVVAMDADVMITIAFCLEVFLFGLAGALFVAHEVRKSRLQATADGGIKPRPIASTAPNAYDETRALAAPVCGAVRGLRS